MEAVRGTFTDRVSLKGERGVRQETPELHRTMFSSQPVIGAERPDREPLLVVEVGAGEIGSGVQSFGDRQLPAGSVSGTLVKTRRPSGVAVTA